MYNPVLKGGFEYDLTGTVLTVASKGRTVVEFPKVAGGGKVCRLDLTGSKGIFSIDLAAYPVNMQCGISDAAWGTSHATGMPWFDHLINVDDDPANVKLGLSRNPKMTTLPTHTYLNFSDALGTQNQIDVIINDTDDAGYTTQPTVLIGSHRQYYTAGATDLWTVGAIGFDDGFGKFQEGVKFTYPAGQNGSSASYYWYTDGSEDFGKFNDPASIKAVYWIRMDGTVNYVLDTSGAGAVTPDGGAGSVAFGFRPPYSHGSGGEITATGRIVCNAVSGTITRASGTSGLNLHYVNASTADYAYENTFLIHADDDLYLSLTYQAF